MKKHYKVLDKKSVKIDPTCKIGKDVVLHENVILKEGCVIEDGVEIFGNTYIARSRIGKDSKIISSFIEDSEIGAENLIGPFARFRPNCKTGNNVKIGNFVEVKNATLGRGTKASHLAYIGDADVGENVNIGCGVIFVNYNGKSKSRIKVCDNAFIGSNVNLIAPLTVAEKSYICAGTTLTDSTQPKDFVIGRVRPTTKENRADEYLK